MGSSSSIYSRMYNIPYKYRIIEEPVTEIKNYNNNNNNKNYIMYKCECGYNTNLKSKFLRHKRVNKCASIKKDQYVICKYYRDKYFEILSSCFTEALSLNTKVSQEHEDEFVNISKDTLHKILLWYYIKYFDNIVTEKKMNYAVDEFKAALYTFMVHEKKRLQESKEYKIQILQDACKCMYEAYPDHLYSGYINVSYEY